MRKRFVLLLFSVVFLLPAAAQKGLAVDEFFDGRFQKRNDAVEVLLSGKHLKDYDLTLFRSLTVPGDGHEGKAIEDAVCADAGLAVQKEVGYKNNRLYYGFFHLPPAYRSTLSRFIFYRNDALRAGRKPTLTLIYMEGTASVEKLRRTFSK